MKTVLHIVLILSLGLAITALFVSNPFSSDSGTSSKSTASAPVTFTIPISERSLDKPTTLATGEDSVRSLAKTKVTSISEKNIDKYEFRSLTDERFEQLFDEIWQAVEVDSGAYAKFGPSAFKENQNEAPGVILAELIRTAPTTDMLVEALRLLAEVSQELWLSPSGLEPDFSSESHQLTMSLIDEHTVGGFLDAVAEVVENGNQRERLAALSTLEDMHQFAPIWEIAYSVLNDPDPQIRMRALELLTYGDLQLATDRLLTALSDPNPAISELAEKLLIGLAEAPS